LTVHFAFPFAFAATTSSSSGCDGFTPAPSACLYAASKYRFVVGAGRGKVECS
jgi:hypothetical protein